MRIKQVITSILATAILLPAFFAVRADTITQDTDNASSSQTETDQVITEEAAASDAEEQIRAFCIRLYDYCLNREPDDYGINDWTQKLLNKEITGAETGYGFVFSDEYQSLRTSNKDYIEMLYKVFLNRASDPDGLSYWLSVFEEGHSREYVFSGFVNSEEYSIICNNYGIERGNYVSDVPRDLNMGITQFVQRLYKTALLRAGEPAGVDYWCKLLYDGTFTFEEVAEKFVNSEEFLTYDYNDEDYLKILYQIFLGREADDYGLNHWLEYLESGKTRNDVLPMFSYSSEFTEIIASFGFKITQISPTTGGSTYWSLVQQNAGKLPKPAEAQSAIIERAQKLVDDGIKYDFGAKIPENGALDCSGYVTDVFRRSLGTMGVTNMFYYGRCDGDGGRGSYFNMFGNGYQDLTSRGSWTFQSSSEGVYSTNSWAGSVFLDKFGIGSPDIMDVSQWKRYLDRLNVSYDYVRYADCMGSSPIRFDDEGNVINWGSWEFLTHCHPGDIVIWPDANEVCSTGNEWNHIGIYAGNGKVYHCSSCNYQLPDLPTDYVGAQLSSIADVRSAFQERGVGGVYIYHVFES